MRYFYLRDKNGFPVGCVASEKRGWRPHIIFGVSSYNQGDKFSKSEARKQAKDRLSGEGRGIVSQGQGEAVKVLILKMIADGATGLKIEGISTASRNAARLWLKEYEDIKSLEAYLEKKSESGTSKL